MCFAPKLPGAALESLSDETARLRLRDDPNHAYHGGLDAGRLMRFSSWRSRANSASGQAPGPGDSLRAVFAHIVTRPVVRVAGRHWLAPAGFGKQ